jgi:hypothetical protein
VASLSPNRLGIVLALTSGVAFAIQPVVGQLALDGGASIAGLLGWRYALAAVVLGVVLYAADAAFFYAALERTSAPFATLLHYAHLVVVVGAAAVLGRERRVVPPDFGARPLRMLQEIEIVNGHDLRRTTRRHQQRVHRMSDIERC